MTPLPPLRRTSTAPDPEANPSADAEEPWARRLTAPVLALFAPGMWPPARIAREAVLSLLLALCGVGLESLEGGNGAVRIAAVALAAVVLTVLRRTLPATVLLVVAVGAVEFVGLFPVLFAASWSAGRRIEPAARATGTLAAAYVLYLVLFVLKELPGFAPPTFAFEVLMTAVAMVVPALLGRYRSQRRTLGDMLREYNAQQLRERRMIAGQARLRERQRIAQDMHDSLGHQLALISVHTGALEVDPELTGRQREAVSVLREASVAATQELREVVGLLRDGVEAPVSRELPDLRVVPDLPVVPVAPPEADAEGPAAPRTAARAVEGIEGLVETSRSAGTRVELRSTGEPRPLAPATGHAAYRLVQEGLTNAHKHAPGAALTVTLGYDDDALAVEIVNGPQLAPAPAPVPGRAAVSGGQGLTGLGERTRLVGGMVHAGPTPEGGFRLAGVLPYAVGAAVPVADPWKVVREPRAPGEWDTEGNGLPKELAKAVQKSRSRGLRIGCGVMVLAALMVLGIGGYFLVEALRDGAIEQKQYDAVKVGQSEKDVRGRLPDGDSFMTEGMVKGGPPRPEGAECLLLVSLDSTEMDKEQVFRFCFRDGKVIEKKTYMVEQ